MTISSQAKGREQILLSVSSLGLRYLATKLKEYPMLTQITGQNFSIDGCVITIFGLQGSPDGKYWDIGIDFLGEGNYVLVQVDPAPASDEVLSAIQQDIDAENYDKICMVAVSNRIAVRLWLEGVLNHSNFKHAQQGEKNGIPFLLLPGFKIGQHAFPLGILLYICLSLFIILTSRAKLRDPTN